MFTVDHDIGGNADNLAESFSHYLPSVRLGQIESRDRFQWSGRMAARNGQALWRIRTNTDWNYQTGPHDQRCLFVTVPETGALKIIDAKREFSARPGTAIILHTPDVRENRASCDGSHLRTSLRWTAAEVERSLSTIVDRVQMEDLPLDPLVNLTDARGEVIRRLLGAIAIDLTSPQPTSTLASELMNEAVLRLMFEPALERLQHRRYRGGPSILPRHVKQAIDFMHANVAKPIRVRDIANACCVTPRTLETGFKAFKDTTPVAYLRQLRLEAVRRELTAATTPVRIAEIARRWGFVDPGRFAERYRLAFGELPSETLRKF